jgi:transcription elongation GreA/GreB family factor
MDKSRLRQLIVDTLLAELAVLTRAANMAREEATSEESKAESKYDTRGQEAAYLAEGQARLAIDLQETIAAFQALPLSSFGPSDRIGLGALVTLEATGGRKSRYLIGPGRGGLEVESEGEVLTVVTPPSPLGRQLLGKVTGDAVQLPGRGGPVPHSLVRVE